MKHTALGLLVVAAVACTASTDDPGGGGDDDGDDVDRPDARPGTAGECPALDQGLVGTHIVANVSWPATTGVNAGSDVVHIWTLSDLSYDGAAVSGSTRPCGSIVPALTASDLLGGGQIQPVIPDDVWDAPSIPASPASGTITGFDPGDTLSMNPSVSLLGATMADPEDGAWPPTGAEMEGVDHDGSGKVGITSVPRADPPFRRPPLDVIGALLPDGARADVLYLTTRNVIALEGTFDTCDSGSGVATFHHFDNHVIGCHVFNGGECTADQVSFVDTNRSVFQVADATFTSVRLPDGARCADVRAALP